MLTFWILQTGEPLHVDAGHPRPMRAMNTANALVAMGHRVVVWSSAFSHQEKRHRASDRATQVLSPLLEYRLIPSPGYARNVGVRRLWDHASLANNLKKWLRESVPPDACLVGYPPIETAWIMVNWLHRRGVPTLVDVKDQWPLHLLEAVPRVLRRPARMLLTPYYLLARRALSRASGISAMSESYLAWALDFAHRRRTEWDTVVRLTSPPPSACEDAVLAARTWWDQLGVTEDGAHFCFVGSHTRSFDFGPLIDAAAALAKSHPSTRLVICGSGDQSAVWRAAAADLPNVLFPGWIDQAQYGALGGRCVGFIAPYKNLQGFELNIPNKIADALAMGLGVVTPLSGEVASLIAEYGAGMRYGEGSGRTLYECLCALLDDAMLRSQQRESALRLYEALFTYDTVYGGLVRHLEALASRAA